MTQVITPTNEQRDIINHPSNLVAIARPGSGKTFVLAEKIRPILSELKEYQGVIAISYTNKASEEIRRRVYRNGVTLKGSFFGTIDRFCLNEIIIPFLPHIWGQSACDVEIIKIVDLPPEERESFSDIEPNCISLEILDKHLVLIRDYFLKGKLFLEFSGAISLFLINNSIACRTYIKSRYSHIFIDEYQDSGLEQHLLFLRLRDMGLIAVAVGDIDQSIFGFSGKHSKYLTELAGLGDFQTFPISRNHRSHPSIINYSLRLLDKESKLIDTDILHIYHAHTVGNQRDIGAWIGQKINVLSQIFDVAKMSNIGILVRSLQTGELIFDALPGKRRFIRSHPLEEHSSVCAKLFARLLEYFFNERITAQEIIDQFGPWSLSAQDVKGCRKQIVKLRREEAPKVEDLIAIASILCPKMISQPAIDLLERSLQEANLSEYFSEPADDEIQILTLHKSKGMEFDIVFHIDLYEWILPAKRLGGDGTDWNNLVFPDFEQDLHLHYVGITRARKSCILCTSTRRINSKGQDKVGSPSEFLGLPGLRDLRRPISTLGV